MTKLWPVTHFNRGIKAIGIDVDDFALHGRRVHRKAYSLPIPRIPAGYVILI
jgi:hypothetical protein